jgi:putative inorganic carbon (HCO3(-)) transporter
MAQKSQENRSRDLFATGISKPATIILLVVVNLAVAAALLLGGGGMAPAIILLVAVLVTGSAIASRPQKGVLLLAALVPFDGLLLIAPIPQWMNGWKEALALLTFCAAMVAPQSARAGTGRRLPPWLPAVAGLGGLALVSAISVGGLQAVVALKIGFFYLLIFAIIWRCPLSLGERDRLVTILMVTGCITAVIGILQQVVGQERLAALGYEYNVTIRTAGGFLRSFSTFNQSFPFALFLMLVLLIGLPVALADPRRLRNRLFLLALPVYGLGLLTTIVRAAWLGLGVGLLYLGVRRFRSLLLPIPLALVALLFLPTGLGAAALSSSSSQERVNLWESNVSTVLAHPLGVGIGASGSASEKAAELDRRDTSTYQPDNYYYKTLYELGLLGLWMLVLLLVSAFLAARAAASRLFGMDAALADGVAASVLAAAVVSTVATYFEIFPMDVYFWLLLGVVATCAPPSR